MLGGRHQSMLSGLLAPTGWRSSKTNEFASKLLEWEIDVASYEAQSGKVFDDDNRVAVVLKWAPDCIRTPIMAGADTNRASYAALRLAIMSFIKCHHSYDSH